ncbi:hypothetical protein PG994_001008 [Apiospora phragmitis]|uniref:Uncharacterized protein n=1 Tax=Apiospora phragmitis TaxID=2905665 RepID=A0ABR1WR81_9PEZI
MPNNRVANCRHTSAAVKQEETDDDTNPSQISGFSRQIQASTPVGQEHHNSKKPVSSRKRAFGEYDWAGNLRAAQEAAERAGIMELPIHDVSWGFAGGRVTGVYDLSMYDNQKHFVSYDGSDLLACVPYLVMKDTVLLKLAKLHIGCLSNSAHPDDVELQQNWHKMEGSDEGSWAIYIHPKADSSPVSRESRETSCAALAGCLYHH